MIGALSGVFGIAVVAGPLIGSTIVQYTTWRWVFYVNIPIGVAGFALIAATLGPLRPELVRKFDMVGAALLFGWVAAVMYPLYQIADSGWAWTDSRCNRSAWPRGCSGRHFCDPRAPNRESFGSDSAIQPSSYGAGGGTTFFIGMVFFPVATFLSLVVGVVLTHGSGSAETVRDILYFLVIPLVIGAALGGQLLTRLPYRIVAALGLVIGIAGMAVLTRLSVSTPLWKFAFGIIPVGGIIVPLIPLGFGYRPDIPGLPSGRSESGENGRRRRSWWFDTVPSIARRRSRVVGAGFIPDYSVFIARPIAERRLLVG